jgi:hypothetical protein
VPLLSVREIAATKAYTIGRRGAYKDYIDLYFILSQQHAMLTDIIDVAEKKFGFEFNSRLFLEQLVFLDDVEDTDIQFLKSTVTRARLLGFFESEHSCRQRLLGGIILRINRTEQMHLNGSDGGAATWNEAEIFSVDCCEFATEMADESCVAAGFYRIAGIGGRGRIGADRARRSCGQPDDSRERFVAARCVAPRGHARRKRSRRP